MLVTILIMSEEKYDENSTEKYEQTSQDNGHRALSVCSLLVLNSRMNVRLIIVLKRGSDMFRMLPVMYILRQSIIAAIFIPLEDALLRLEGAGIFTNVYYLCTAVTAILCIISELFATIRTEHSRELLSIRN